MNGRIYDPANGRNGAAATLCVRDGRVVAESALDDSALVFDARGMAVLPGGVDMHAHIAGPKVSAARRMRPEDHRDAPVRRTAATRSGVMGSTPSTFATGYAYARLGYTTVIDAAVSPLGARHAHDELADTPIIDKGFLALLGNNEYVLRCVRQGEPKGLPAGPPPLDRLGSRAHRRWCRLGNVLAGGQGPPTGRHLQARCRRCP